MTTLNEIESLTRALTTLLDPASVYALACVLPADTSFVECVFGFGLLDGSFFALHSLYTLLGLN